MVGNKSMVMFFVHQHIRYYSPHWLAPVIKLQQLQFFALRWPFLEIFIQSERKFNNQWKNFFSRVYLDAHHFLVQRYFSMRYHRSLMVIPVEVYTHEWEVSNERCCFFLVRKSYLYLGQLWMKQLLVGAFFVPVIICGVSFLVNFISIYYGSSRSIPFTVMVCLKNKKFSFFYFEFKFENLVKCYRNLFVYYFTINCRRNGIRKKY
jgi:hypothetical protein